MGTNKKNLTFYINFAVFFTCSDYKFIHPLSLSLYMYVCVCVQVIFAYRITICDFLMSSLNEFLFGKFQTNLKTMPETNFRPVPSVLKGNKFWERVETLSFWMHVCFIILDVPFFEHLKNLCEQFCDASTLSEMVVHVLIAINLGLGDTHTLYGHRNPPIQHAWWWR